jgi:hypothetical protein
MIHFRMVNRFLFGSGLALMLRVVHLAVILRRGRGGKYGKRAGARP